MIWPSAVGGRPGVLFKSHEFCHGLMRVRDRSVDAAFLLIGLLLLQILGGLSSPATTLEIEPHSKHIHSSLTNNGDGTWSVIYSIDMDTTLDSGNSTTDRTGFSRFEVGWTDDRQETRIGLLALDLDTQNCPTNTTIESASLELYLDATSGPVDAQA